MQTFRRSVTRLALVAATVTFALTGVGAAVVWATARQELTHLRAASAEAQPVTPTVSRALLATNPAFLTYSQLSVGGVYRSLARGRGCGATLAFLVVRDLTPRSRMLRWHIETAITTAVVAYTFAPEDLLRIYVHEVYLGEVGGSSVYGFEAGSSAYFGKTARDLTPSEAALLVAILPYPSQLSPYKDPARALQRRDRVLTEMLRRGYLNERQFTEAIAEPLRLAGA